MTCVVDASVVVAVLTDAYGAGAWAADRLRGEEMLSPHLMPVEVTQSLRRLVVTGALTESEGLEALQGLLSWPVTPVDFAPVAARVWELRETVSAYDAWHVALAEAADVPLVTLDARLARAPGPRCTFEVAPAD